MIADEYDRIRRAEQPTQTQQAAGRIAPSELFLQELATSTNMAVENMKALYAWSKHTLKEELTSRNPNFRDDDTKAVLVELVIADMLRNEAAAAIGAHASEN